MNSYKDKLLTSCLSAVLMAAAACGSAQAQAKDQNAPKGTSVASDDTALDTVVVVGAKPGITNIKPTATVSGLNQAITDIPRGITTLDSSLLKDIQATSIHDLTMVAAGTYTSAYFGVAGDVEIRGNVADNYYRGFKGANNLGYYETPTESVSNIEIVRGPVSPMYGTGKLGGMLNLTPKTDVAERLKEGQTPTALLTAETGSNNLAKFTAEGGMPFQVGGNNAAIYLYGYVNENGSWYRDFHPDDKEGQVGYSMDIGPDWQLNLGGRYLDSKGHLAAPGWNRLTQDLVDNGNYISGTALTPLAKPGEQFITGADISPVLSKIRLAANLLPGGVIPQPNIYTELNPATVKTVQLSTRDLNTSSLDYNNNDVGTAYGDLIHTGKNGDVLKIQGFYEHLDNNMFSAAGSATFANVSVAEGRLSYLFTRDLTPWLSAQSIAGVSYRYSDIIDNQNYGRKFVGWDRADISQPLTADMIFNDPALSGYQWDFRYHSRIGDAGAFLNTDISLFNNLHVQGGVRYDNYDIHTINNGFTTFGGALGTWYQASIAPVSYQISVNYHTPWGIVPYYTYANNRSLETNKGGGVDPALLINKDFLSPSELNEIGIKGSLLDHKLYFSLDTYHEVRSQRDALSTAISSSHSNGVEFEGRVAVTSRLDILATATWQQTRIFGATTFLITPLELGFANPTALFAGEWNASTTQVPAISKSYVDKTLPAEVASLFATYRIGGGFKVSGGGQYTSETSGVAPEAVHLKPYVTLRILGSYAWRNYTFDAAIDNLSDQRYFYLGQGAYTDAAALPAAGRTFTLRAAAKF